MTCWPAVAAACAALALPAQGGPLPQRAELKAAHPAELDYLGAAVAVAGGTIAAAAPTHMSHGRVVEGKVLVFVTPWSGVRRPAATLRPPRGASYDGFGESVAMAGDTIVVGAGGSGLDHDPWPGRAYVFTKPRGGWHGTIGPSATLRSSGAAGGQFGYAVAISGRTIAVGAPNTHRYRGAAYVFVRPGSGWRGVRGPSATLAGGRGEAGFSVAVSGDAVVAGAPFRGHGAAFVYSRPRAGWSGTRVPAATLSAAKPHADFGFAAAIAGDTIAVGAPGGARGEAYVFVRAGARWPLAATLDAPDRATADTCGVRGDRDAASEFARTLAMSGNRILVGNGGHGGGRFLATACLFTMPATGWAGSITQATNVERPKGSGSRSSRFGRAVAVDRDTIVSSSFGLRSGSTLSAGAVFVF